MWHTLKDKRKHKQPNKFVKIGLNIYQGICIAIVVILFILCLIGISISDIDNRSTYFDSSCTVGLLPF